MAARQSIDVADLPLHDQPFPAATRKGSFIFSSAISGRSRGDGKVPENAKEQVRNAFANMRTIVEAAGASVDDICKVQCFLADRDMRPMVNEEWVKMFPDEASRPVRHTIGGPLPGNYIIQLEFTAVTG